MPQSEPTVLSRVRPPAPRRVVDPLLLTAIALLVLIGLWTMAPLATSAVGPIASDTRIEVTVPTSTSVTPGWQTGAAVSLPDLSFPGEPQDVTSTSWRMTTNYATGYEVRIRSTTNPAMRGLNAVDGSGARSSFLDFTTTGCPCPWTTKGFDRGVFGYSVSVNASNGMQVNDVDKWGTRTARRWRGLSRTPYRAYSTTGGTGQYDMSIHLRSMIPDGTVQVEGSYRAGLVVSAHPLA